MELSWFLLSIRAHCRQRWAARLLACFLGPRCTYPPVQACAVNCLALVVLFGFFTHRLGLWSKVLAVKCTKKILITYPVVHLKSSSKYLPYFVAVHHLSLFIKVNGCFSGNKVWFVCFFKHINKEHISRLLNSWAWLSVSKSLTIVFTKLKCHRMNLILGHFKVSADVICHNNTV